MKKIVVIGLFLLWSNAVSAQAIDLLSGDLTMPENEQKVEDEKDISQEALKEDVDSTEVEEDSGDSFFSFITKPIAKLFLADEEVVDSDGKKETFLEQNLRLASKGDAEAQMNLGYMYLYGNNGVERDFDKAFKYYNMAAEQDNPIALNNVGSLYFNGIGVEKNRSEAIKYFRKSAQLGNDNAATNLAFIYLTGNNNDSDRNKQAIRLFQQAAKNGNKLAEFMLGYAYYRGFTVDPDNYAAFKLIKDAADEKAEFDEAQLVLGEMYANGYGTVQNYVSAVSYYTRAVNQGNTEAYTELAKIYAGGKVAQRNMVKAHALFNIAASEGNVKAAELRDEIGQLMKLEMLLEAQKEAQNFKPEASELTSYVRQTFGNNVRNYIDKHIKTVKKVDTNEEKNKKEKKEEKKGAKLL